MRPKSKSNWWEIKSINAEWSEEEDQILGQTQYTIRESLKILKEKESGLNRI